jgi:hypothetical protein
MIMNSKSHAIRACMRMPRDHSDPQRNITANVADGRTRPECTDVDIDAPYECTESPVLPVVAKSTTFKPDGGGS